MNHLLAAGRVAAGAVLLPALLGIVALQGFVVGPVFKNQTVLPRLFYNGLRKLFGMKVEFNKASAPLETKRPTWFVANHMSIADFITMGSTVNGTFAGKGDILLWPGVAQLARAVKYIGIRRSREFNPQTRAKLAQNFNAGHSLIMFPEGTTTDGKEVALFRAGLIGLLYGEEARDKEGNDVKLDKDVVLQPIAIRVKEVNGQDAIDNDELRNRYSLYHENNTLRRIWKRLGTTSMTLELTAFPPMDPADYTDGKALINAAHDKVRSVVAPRQTTVAKAQIPGMS